jgi:hypothetical protein
MQDGSSSVGSDSSISHEISVMGQEQHLKAREKEIGEAGEERKGERKKE